MWQASKQSLPVSTSVRGVQRIMLCGDASLNVDAASKFTASETCCWQARVALGFVSRSKWWRKECLHWHIRYNGFPWCVPKKYDAAPISCCNKNKVGGISLHSVILGRPLKSDLVYQVWFISTLHTWREDSILSERIWRPSPSQCCDTQPRQVRKEATASICACDEGKLGLL